MKMKAKELCIIALHLCLLHHVKANSRSNSAVHGNTINTKKMERIKTMGPKFRVAEGEFIFATCRLRDKFFNDTHF